jgi:hypothetical protein
MVKHHQLVNGDASFSQRRFPLRPLRKTARFLLWQLSLFSSSWLAGPNTKSFVVDRFVSYRAVSDKQFLTESISRKVAFIGRPQTSAVKTARRETSSVRPGCLIFQSAIFKFRQKFHRFTSSHPMRESFVTFVSLWPLTKSYICKSEIGIENFDDRYRREITIGLG